MDKIKKDRLIDQKIILQLENSISFYESRMNEFDMKIIQNPSEKETSRIRAKNKRDVKFQILPIQKSLDRSLNAMKRKLDMTDVSNRKLIEKINFLIN
jgi:hypothetical protein